MEKLKYTIVPAAKRKYMTRNQQSQLSSKHTQLSSPSVNKYDVINAAAANHLVDALAPAVDEALVPVLDDVLTPVLDKTWQCYEDLLLKKSAESTVGTTNCRQFGAVAECSTNIVNKNDEKISHKLIHEVDHHHDSDEDDDDENKVGHHITDHIKRIKYENDSQTQPSESSAYHYDDHSEITLDLADVESTSTKSIDGPELSDGQVINDSLGNEKRLRPSSYKDYHRQIEKKRRNKISALIADISCLVPMCEKPAQRLDKLTVLQFAVQHLRMLTHAPVRKESGYKPSFLSEEEFKYLFDQKGFLLVVACDKANILYISESISKTKIGSPALLLGRSLLEMVHADDVSLITNMLMAFPNAPIVGSTDMYSGKGISGAKRSFYFRLKTATQLGSCASGVQNPSREMDIVPVYVNGFVKTFENGACASDSTTETDLRSMFHCFIGLVKVMDKPAAPQHTTTNAFARASKREALSSTPTSTAGLNSSPTCGTGDEYKHYSSRHTADAKYLSVDQRVFPIAGYLPQDLVGNSEYSFVHKDDVNSLSKTYRQALANKHQEIVISDIYRFKMKHGGLVPMRTIATSLFNPFTHELEFVTHENYVIRDSDSSMTDNRFLATPTRTEDQRDHSDSSLSNRDDVNGKSLDVPSSSQQLPVMSPQTIDILRGCGLNQQLLSNLVMIQRRKELSCDTSNLESFPTHAQTLNSSSSTRSSSSSTLDVTMDWNKHISSKASVSSTENVSSGYMSGYMSGKDTDCDLL